MLRREIYDYTYRLSFSAVPIIIFRKTNLGIHKQLKTSREANSSRLLLICVNSAEAESQEDSSPNSWLMTLIARDPHELITTPADLQADLTCTVTVFLTGDRAVLRNGNHCQNWSWPAHAREEHFQWGKFLPGK